MSSTLILSKEEGKLLHFFWTELIPALHPDFPTALKET